MRLRKRGFYHYESWRLASSCCSDFLEKSGDGGDSFGAVGVHQAEGEDSVSISFDPSTGRVPATCGGIRSQDTSANERRRNPAQARIFKPRPPPREKKNKKKNFWLCGYVH